MSWSCPGCARVFDGHVQRYPYNLCQPCYFNPTIVERFHSQKSDSNHTAKLAGPLGPVGAMGPACGPGPCGPTDPADSSSLVSIDNAAEPDPMYDIDKSFSKSFRDQRITVNGEPGTAEGHMPTSCAAETPHDDVLKRQMSKLQLIMGGQISQTSGLKAIGFDFKDELRRMMEEQQFQAEEQAKLQAQMVQSGAYNIATKGYVDIEEVRCKRQAALVRWTKWMEANPDYYSKLVACGLTKYGWHLGNELRYHWDHADQLAELEMQGLAFLHDGHPMRFCGEDPSPSKRIMPPIGVKNADEDDSLPDKWKTEQREEQFARKLLPPLLIQNDELDRSEPTDMYACVLDFVEAQPEKLKIEINNRVEAQLVGMSYQKDGERFLEIRRQTYDLVLANMERDGKFADYNGPTWRHDNSPWSKRVE